MPWGGGPSQAPIYRSCFAQVGPDATVAGDGLDSSIQGRPGEVEVVQKRDQAVVRVKGGSRAVQGIVLARKQCRGQRAPLFAAFALLDLAAPPLVVHQL